MQCAQRTHLGARDPNVQHGGARKAHNSCLCMSPGDASSLAQLDEFVRVVDMRDGDAAQRFTNSLKETGFAVVTNHGLDYSLVSSVYAEWRDFYVSGQVFWSALFGFGCRAAAECHVRALPRVLPDLTPPVCQADQDKYVRNVSTQDGYFNIKEAESAKGMEVCRRVMRAIFCREADLTEH